MAQAASLPNPDLMATPSAHTYLAVSGSPLVSQPFSYTGVTGTDWNAVFPPSNAQPGQFIFLGDPDPIFGIAISSNYGGSVAFTYRTTWDSSYNAAARTGLFLKSPLSLQPNTRYQVTLKVASEVFTPPTSTSTSTTVPTKPSVQLSVFTEPAAGTNFFAAQTSDVAIDGVEHTITFNFVTPADIGSTNPAKLGLAPRTAQGRTIYISDLRIDQIDADPINLAKDITFNTTTNSDLSTPFATPNTLFGMHVNKLAGFSPAAYGAGLHRYWAPLGQEVIRLTATGTDWKNIEPGNPSSTQRDFSRLDDYVTYAAKKSATSPAQLIYTAGLTPTWAASEPTKTDCPNDPSPGVCSPPASLSSWTNYITAILTRYNGKIQYLEMWNEANIRFGALTAPKLDGSGNPVLDGNGNPVRIVVKDSPAYMADLTCEAKRIRDLIAPSIKIISPAMSEGGALWLDNYLAAGGKSCVDIINYHGYYSPTTLESDIPSRAANTKMVAKSYGLQNLPMWDTEGAALCGGEGISCNGASTPSTAIQQGMHSRALAMLLAQSVGNMNYFYLEGAFPDTDPWSGLIDRNSLTAYSGTGAEPVPTTTTAGVGYQRASTWLKGSQLVNFWKHPTMPVYIFKLRTLNDDPNWPYSFLVWNFGTASQTFNLPTGSSTSCADKFFKIESADGTINTSLFAFSNVTLSPNAPVMLRHGACIGG